METIVPKNIQECFTALEDIFKESEEDFKLFKSAPEEKATVNMHHGLGRWIRNNWGLWKKDTDLYNIMTNIGLWHADDMSSLILISYHRHINGKEINLKEQVAQFVEYWSEYEKENGPIQK